MNRITSAFNQMAAQVASKNLAPERLAAISKSFDMDLNEYCQFQTRKTLAVGNKLSLEEAQTVYACLGESLETFNGQPVHIKAVLTKLFGELLAAGIAAKRGAA